MTKYRLSPVPGVQTTSQFFSCVSSVHDINPCLFFIIFVFGQQHKMKEKNRRKSDELHNFMCITICTNVSVLT